MKLSFLMGIIAIACASLIAVGMTINDQTYWFWVDVITIPFFVLVGIRLFQESKRK